MFGNHDNSSYYIWPALIGIHSLFPISSTFFLKLQQAIENTNHT